MTLRWQGRSLWVDTVSVDAMGRLVCCAPQGREETQILAALLAGVKVYVPREGLEYRQYRKIAPAGIYRRLMALERELREMGIIVVRNGGGKSLGHKEVLRPGGTDFFDRSAGRG